MDAALVSSDSGNLCLLLCCDDTARNLSDRWSYRSSFECVGSRTNELLNRAGSSTPARSFSERSSLPTHLLRGEGRCCRCPLPVRSSQREWSSHVRYGR
jgi:hypothetical protein